MHAQSCLVTTDEGHGVRNGAFGFFDCIDDAEVADALLPGRRPDKPPARPRHFRQPVEQLIV
jgi:hypothetical protein